MLMSSAAGWLVAVFSFESSSTAVLPVPVISRPKFVAGLEIQPCTWLVTLTTTNVPAVLTLADANGAPAVVGCVAKVTEFSFHNEVTWVKFSEPPAVTLST
jgi:hypothetical protein